MMRRLNGGAHPNDRERLKEFKFLTEIKDGKLKLRCCIIKPQFIFLYVNEIATTESTEHTEKNEEKRVSRLCEFCALCGYN